MPACLQCNEPFPEAPRRGARPQAYCTPKCQQKAANARRASTRSGRLREAPYTPKSVSDSSIDLANLSTPPEAPTPANQSTRAVVAQLFGQWYVRMDGHLVFGPMMDKLRAQDRADLLNARA